jgi:type II secretory pathway component GspD/PulD (secretin)
MGSVAGAALLLLIGSAHLLNCTATRGDEPAPVFSFDAATPDADVAGQPTAEPLLSFNFRFAPWPDVLKLFAETAGLTLDLKDTPPGTFSYFDSTKYTPTQALDVLNGYLLPRGYVLVRRNRFLVCLNIDQGIPPNVVPTVSPEELADRGDNELVTVVFQLVDGNAEQAASEVQQLLGPQGKAVALRASNSLLVTDVGSNLRLVDGLLKRSAGRRETGGPNGTEFRAFPLKHISAREAERLVRDLFGLAARTESPGANPPAAASHTGRAAGAIQLTAESRINSLLVRAPSHDVQLIEQLLQAADVEMSAGESASGAGKFRTAVEVVPLGGADAARIGRALGSLSPRIRVSTTGSSTPPADTAQRPSTPTAGRPPAGNGGAPAPQPPSPSNNGQGADPNGR